MTLKSTWNIEQYNQRSHDITSALRTELGCDEPLCVLAVTAAPGSVILTVVATDRASDSQVHAAATVMVSVDVDTLSARLNIDLSEAPVVQPVRNVQVVHWIVASPPPVLQEKENAISAENDQEDSGGIIAGAAGGGGALLVLALVGAVLLKRTTLANTTTKLTAPTYMTSSIVFCSPSSYTSTTFS